MTRDSLHDLLATLPTSGPISGTPECVALDELEKTVTVAVGPELVAVLEQSLEMFQELRDVVEQLAETCQQQHERIHRLEEHIRDD